MNPIFLHTKKVFFVFIQKDRILAKNMVLSIFCIQIMTNSQLCQINPKTSSDLVGA